MYICICNQVTDKQINAAIEDGASSLYDLRKELGVANQCGQCGQCARGMLKEHRMKTSVHVPFIEQVPATLLAGAMLASD
ncbi:MAG: bacterioferritin-associated ferredoxin [Gammaproteobacteria bacterium]|nr:bacterioferritin-associated ferredoxin [Gammaproteobacteria bacterium]